MVKLDWSKLPNGLQIYDFKDFCIRCEEVYNLFWEAYAPFFDITIYREYLLNDVYFSKNKNRQETLAGLVWEYLMGDLSLPHNYKEQGRG